MTAILVNIRNVVIFYTPEGRWVTKSIITDALGGFSPSKFLSAISSADSNPCSKINLQQHLKMYIYMTGRPKYLILILANINVLKSCTFLESIKMLCGFFLVKRC